MKLGEFIEKMQELEGSYGPTIDVCIGQDPVGAVLVAEGSLDERPYVTLVR